MNLAEAKTTRLASYDYGGDLDKYLRDKIWQRTAQDRLTWRRHAEAFTQPWDDMPA